jgi:flagellar basal body-associated protein FliL
MLIVVAVAMLRAAMLVLVAVLMVIATLHLQEDESGNPKDGAKHASRKQTPEDKEEEVSMCIHLYAFVCICMLAAVLMVTMMQRHQMKKPASPLVPPNSSSEEEAEEEEEEEVSISVCGDMHLHA